MNDSARPQREIGLLTVEQLRALDGLELFQGIIAGQIPAPPITATLGFWLHEAEVGRVVFAGAPERRHYNPIGSVHGGFAATLLDSAMSCAVHTHLKKGFGYTTVEFKVNFVRASPRRPARSSARAAASMSAAASARPSGASPTPRAGCTPTAPRPA